MFKQFVSNRRWHLILVIATVAMATLTMLARQTRVFAHAGHGNEEIGAFDLDAPRVLSPETAKHIGLKVMEVDTMPMEDVLEISGVVHPNPDKHREVVSRVAGKLLTIRKQIGDSVKKGDLLAEVDSPEQARSLYEVRKLEVEYQKLLMDVDRRWGDAARLQADIDSLSEQTEVARKDYQRSLSVAAEGMAVREVEIRRAQQVKLEGELKGKNVEIEIARKEAEGLRKQADALKLSRGAMLAIYNIDSDIDGQQQIGGALSLLAEADGVVVERRAMPGHWVQAGERILTIADYSSVQIEGELPESLIPRIEKRSVNKVRVRPASDPSVVLEGTVKFIAPQLEPVKRTAHLVVDVPNPRGILRGEMWVNLAIVLGEKKASLVVPKSAVIVNGPMHFVFLEIESGDAKTGQEARYQKHDINPGLSNDLFVEVKDGVFPGDRVVTTGAYSLTQLRPKAGAKAVAGTESAGQKK